MYIKLLEAVTVLCIVIGKTGCERNYDGRPFSQGYTKYKREKYYSSPPQRFYSRPPASFPNPGAFSYTPPPDYMMKDEEPPYPGNFRPFKVSKKPTTEGLGDEDISNIINYLSKQDLDKIAEFAGSQNKYSGSNSKDSYEKQNANYKPQFRDDIIIRDYDNSMYKAANQPLDPNLKQEVSYLETKPFGTRVSLNQEPEATPTSFNPDFVNQIYSIPSLDTEESMITNQLAYLHSQNGEIYTDSQMIPEESLPKPMNLRDAFETSYTNNMPIVVKPEPSSYKLENFGVLPVMDYHSKLDTRSSYHVPHYTVTSSSKPPSTYSKPSSYYASAPSSYSLLSSDKVPFEPAPPASFAKDQSDAHLKAIKIWTHKSKGTAYYLHDDGTLSLEKPRKPSYGIP